MKVPLSIFSNFVGASPQAKLKCVAQVRSGYDVRTDWYKQLREAIPATHRDRRSKDDLRRFAETVGGRKAESYRTRVDAYCAWWGDRHIGWEGGKPYRWVSGAIEVTVNPELIVSIDGQRQVVKLHFSEERLTASRVNTILRLLELGYRRGESPDGKPVVGVLDLAQGRLMTPSLSLNYLDPVLAGEAAALDAMLRV
jgi:hypothetical protein